MKHALILCAILMLAACGGGDAEPEEAEAESTMPCKYRPDCTAGPPVGSTPVPPASAAGS